LRSLSPLADDQRVAGSSRSARPAIEAGQICPAPINPGVVRADNFQQLPSELRILAPRPKRTISVVKRRNGLLNLVLRGIAGGGGTVHIVPFYGPLLADPEDNRYWGEHSLAACGRNVRIRVAPTNLPSAASEVAARLN
jgi:hypothetical protein